MKIDDWLLVVSTTKNSNDQIIGGIDGTIVNLTDKAILVEWKVETSDKEETYYRTWIPKSLIFVIETHKMKKGNEIINSYAITLPEWVKLTVTSKIE